MNTETYRALRSATGKYADEHYACMQEWLAKKKDPEVQKRCRTSALRYRRAIEGEIKYLKTRPETAEVLNRIDQMDEFLRLVAQDILFLTQH